MYVTNRTSVQTLMKEPVDEEADICHYLNVR